MVELEPEKDKRQMLMQDVDEALKSFPYPEGTRDLVEQNADKLIPLWSAWKNELESAKKSFGLETDNLSIPQALEAMTNERLEKRSGDKMIVGIVGAAGCGKDTVAKKAGMPTRSLQTTTRKPRAGEVNGKDYEFLSEQEFDDAELFFKTPPKPGRGRYGFRKENIDKGFVDGTAVVIQSARDSVTMCEKFASVDPETNSVVVYVLPGEPVFAHLALRYAKRIVEEGGKFEEGIEGTLGQRNIDEFKDVIALQQEGKNIAFLVNDSLDTAAKKLGRLLER